MNARSEMSIAGVLIGFCVLNYFYLIPTQVVAEGSSPVYPLLVNSMLLCFSLAYLAESFRVMRREKSSGQEGGGKQSSDHTLWRPLAMLVTTGAWVLTMEWLGFILSTFIFLLIASRIFGSKKLIPTLGLSVIMPLVIHFVFVGLNSVLPEGPVEELLTAIIG